MIPSDTPDTSLAELRALSSEIKEWALGIRCVFAVLNVLPLYYCTRVLLAAPRFESIFEDMLGPKNRLPLMTQWVFKWQIPLLGCTWLLAGFAILLIFIVRKPRHVWLTAAFSSFMLIVTGHLVATALMEPLISLIQGLSGPGL